jgi:hypothetical protein
MPAIERTMSPGFVAWPPGMFSHAEVDRQLELRHGLEHAEHRGAAAHVELHLVHLVGRLDRDAARVEGDALADERDRPGVLRPPAVFEHDQLRRLARALRHRQERAHAQLLQRRAVERAGLDRGMLAREARGRLRQVSGGADVGGRVAQVPDQRRAGADGEALGERALRVRQVGLARHVEGDALEPGRRQLGARLLAAAGVEAVVLVLLGERGLPHVPCRVAALERQVGKIRDGVHRAGGAQRARRRRAGAAVGGLVEIALAPEAHQQHAVAVDLRHVVQDERLAGLAVEVAAAQRAGDAVVAGGVQRLGRGGQAAAVENAHNDAPGPLPLRVAALDEVIHACAFRDEGRAVKNRKIAVLSGKAPANAAETGFPAGRRTGIVAKAPPKTKQGARA